MLIDRLLRTLAVRSRLAPRELCAENDSRSASRPTRRSMLTRPPDGEIAMDKLFGKKPFPTTIFASSDYLVFGLLNELRNRRIPTCNVSRHLSVGEQSNKNRSMASARDSC